MNVDTDSWKVHKSEPLTLEQKEKLAEANRHYLLEVEAALKRRLAALSKMPKGRILD